MGFWEEHAIKWDCVLTKESAVTIQRAKIEFAPNQKYAHFGQIELLCNRNTTIETINDKSISRKILPQIWNFISSIGAIKTKKDGDMIDVIGVVVGIGTIKSVNTKKGKSVAKKTVTIMDKTAKVNVYLWDGNATVPIEMKKIIAIKKGKVNSYSGSALNVVGFVELQPKHTAKDELQQWINEKNKTLLQITIKIKNLTNAKAEDIDWTAIDVQPLSNIVHDQQMYRYEQVLPKKENLKTKAKIKAIDGQLWFFKNSRYNYRIKITIQGDDNKWIQCTAWEKVGLKLFNSLTADQVREMQRTKPDEFAQVMNNLISLKQEYIFYIQMKENAYWKPKRLEYTMVDFQKTLKNN